MLNRRDFLTIGTGGMVTLVLTRVIPGCGSSSSNSTTSTTNPTTPTCDGAGETSSVTLGHTHDLCVPLADLTTPPAAGATYTTTVTDDHEHNVTLTEAMLATVAQGGSVMVTSSVVATSALGTHTHDFIVQKGATQPAPAPTATGGGPY